MPFIPNLTLKGSFGAGPSGSTNRVGSVAQGGLDVPAYPAFREQSDIATEATSGVPWSELEMIGFVALIGLVALVEWKRGK